MHRHSTLRGKLEQRSAQLRAIGEISAALASAWELETTLDVITGVSSRVMQVDSCSIYLQERAGGRLVLKATTGLDKSAIGHASLAAGEGLTGWAVTHGQPVAAQDALLDPRFKLLPETHEEVLRSLLAVPLSVQGRTIGAMNVQTRQPHAFSEDEVELLSLIANLAAGALEKASLYDRMRRQIQELSALAEISKTVTSPLYLDEMLGVLTEMASRVMGAKATTLHLLDEATGHLVLHAAHGTDLGLRRISSIASGQGVVGEAASTGLPVVVPDVLEDPRYLNREVAAKEGLVSLLSVPLVVRERTVGVFSCYMGARHEFTPKEIELFQTLANQTALAIDNARLVINTAVVHEMHHRIKNNLQTVVMLLRMRLSDAGRLTAEDILTETISRILSIAAVHETLSESGLRLVDVKDVLERVARSVSDIGLSPKHDIQLVVQGDALVLPSKEATSLALATSELVQNAVKHAFVGRERGCITVTLSAGESDCQVWVEDDGIGIGASSGTRRGIGLQIVEALAADDLKGSFEHFALEEGTRAVIRFPKSLEKGGQA